MNSSGIGRAKHVVPCNLLHLNRPARPHIIAERALAVDGLHLAADGQPSVLHSLPADANVYEPLRLLAQFQSAEVGAKTLFPVAHPFLC